MTPANLSLAPTPAPEGEVRLDALYRPFLRRWRLVALCVIVACGAAVAATLLPRREYRAQLLVAAVPNTKGASLSGGLSALMGNAAMGGVQSTPYFITRLLMMPGVLHEVARSSVDSTRGATVIERVLEKPASAIDPARVDAAMRALVSTEVDKQSGLVTFAVTHPDSAVARRVAEGVLAAAGRAYVRVLRTQATDQRESGAAQVDSARRQLRNAEARLQEFVSSHRLYAPYSPAALERQRIDRDVSAAQSVYADAVSDRQGAIARELADTPALVVVDPIPSELMPLPRQGALKIVIAIVIGVVLAGVIMAVGGEFAAPRAGEVPSSRAAVAA